MQFCHVVLRSLAIQQQQQNYKENNNKFCDKISTEIIHAHTDTIIDEANRYSKSIIKICFG